MKLETPILLIRGALGKLAAKVESFKAEPNTPSRFKVSSPIFSVFFFLFFHHFVCCLVVLRCTPHIGPVWGLAGRWLAATASAFTAFHRLPPSPFSSQPTQALDKTQTVTHHNSPSSPLIHCINNQHYQRVLR